MKLKRNLLESLLVSFSSYSISLLETIRSIRVCLDCGRCLPYQKIGVDRLHVIVFGLAQCPRFAAKEKKKILTSGTENKNLLTSNIENNALT
jgi:hypothetical protein